MVQVSIF